MSEETIVAIYDTTERATAAVDALKQAGVPESAISLHAGDGGSTMTAPAAMGTSATEMAPATMGMGTPMGMATPTTMTGAPPREQGFWASLFGGDSDYDSAVYDRSVQSGSTVVTVKCPETHIDRVMEILESHGPVDIDERATGYGLAKTAQAAPSTASMPASTSARTGDGADSLQLSEEKLAVGKRVVNRGGTRIRRYVVETPVQEDVTLHTETVSLERRPVTDERPLHDSAFTDKTIEMTETSEEPIVSKTARVYEEVGLRKEVKDRVETVRDSVRKEQVEVEQIPGGTATTTTDRPVVSPMARPKV